MPSTSFVPPGVIANASDFERVRTAIARPGLLRDLAAFVFKLADHELSEPVVTREMEGRRLLHISRLVLRRVINCGIAWQLRRDKRHARRAILDLKAAASFSDWNPSHFLDVSEMCCAFALGLDWLHDSLTGGERTGLEEALIRLGLEAGLADPGAWFVSATNNWNAVCNGGLAMGAIAIRHRRPDLAGTLIARCIDRLPAHGANYAPDGAFIEGPMYWAFGTVYHVLAVESLLRATGSTHGLDALPGFRESAAYMTHIAGPTGEFYPYFDARAARIPLPALAWFGRHFDDPMATLTEAAAIRRSIAGPAGEVLWTENRCFALSLLWLQPEHLDHPAQPALAWSGQGLNPAAFWRNDWTPGATWVGAKGGRATLSHGHIDAGSFVFDAGGVRWAVDPGMEEYHRLEAMGVKLWGADRWNLFRLGPESHSIPRIDDLRPAPDGECPRIRWTTTPRPAVAFDLTALYPDAVTRLHRCISSEPEAITRWQDEVQGLAPGRIYRFTWVTTAGVRIDGDAVILEQNGRRLRLEPACASPVTVRIIDQSELIRPHDRPVPGLKRVDFSVVSRGDAFSFGLLASLVAWPGQRSRGAPPF